LKIRWNETSGMGRRKRRRRRIRKFVDPRPGVNLSHLVAPGKNNV
jgi:hypothetical protein